MRIDLGSGKNKHRDCIGVDRARYRTTDIVHDLNRRLPFQDHSVSFVMCSHSLQHVDDVNAVMREIYRICRHKAVVCVVAPYASGGSGENSPPAEPQFNEYWPRMLSLETRGDHREGPEPQGQENAVSGTITGEPQMDFRLLRMEFFYFPSFYGLYDEVELALLRQTQPNVAYQIMYHFLVAKEPVAEGEIASIVQGGLEEPEYVRDQRRLIPPGSAEDVEEEEEAQLAAPAAAEAKPKSPKPAKLKATQRSRPMREIRQRRKNWR
ncbi:methyltransferase domain-containing protein [Paenibacillus sp. NFR01]|uniref:methyltransferase domain-containing protein n=1 Tax=Paenibacillus sp. NFR01 TaxID=1566279 RepID=UPI0008CBDEDF|nr:methyltransferase domain-containing protein [Paenibacillus sp. NFR01]SET89314.1 Methyltransferase domain-containing protein [Paenibacillus sp. NFR01]